MLFGRFGYNDETRMWDRIRGWVMRLWFTKREPEVAVVECEPEVTVAKTKSRISAVVEMFLDEDGWSFSRSDGAGGSTIFRTGFKGKNGEWQCIAQAQDDKDRFIFYSILPHNVPEDRMRDIVELTTRMNHGMLVGNFELNIDGGEIRYKTSIDVEGGQLTIPMVKAMIYMNVLIVDKYLPGILSVLCDGRMPHEAVEEVEG